MRHLLILPLLLIATPAFAIIMAPVTSVFDKPLAVKHVTAITDTGTNEEVDCFYYPEFMVKQVDAHEKGAAQLSFVPIRNGEAQPLCQRSNISAEKVVPPAEWSGYFTGVKASYAFFDADDGVNGGMGFAVYDAKNGSKRFSDTMRGNFQALSVNGSTLTLKYMRAFTADCSVVMSGGECWSSILEATKLPPESAMPNCEASYISADKYLAKARCRAEKGAAGAACYKRELAAITAQHTGDAYSMIGYPAIATLKDTSSEIAPDVGKAFCWPSS